VKKEEKRVRQKQRPLHRKGPSSENVRSAMDGDVSSSSTSSGCSINLCEMFLFLSFAAIGGAATGKISLFIYEDCQSVKWKYGRFAHAQ